MKMRLLFFLVIASLVKIQAYALGLVDEPEKCFSQRIYPCSITSRDGNLKIVRDDLQINMSEDSVVTFEDERRLKILKGHLIFSSAHPVDMMVSSLLAFKVKGEIFAMIESPKTVRLYNLNAEIDFIKGKLFQSEVLPVGFENWYSGLNAHKQIDRGLIAPIERLSFLKKWGSVSLDSVAESRKKMKNYDKVWGDSVADASQFYQEVVERGIASENEKIAREIERKNKREKEKAFFRRMYREKVGLEAGGEP